MKILVFGLQGSGKGDVAKHLSEQIKGVHIDASDTRTETENWSWGIQDRKKVCEHLGIAAHGVELSDKIAVIEGIVEFYEDRRGLNADYIIWANTCKDCSYDDTSFFFKHQTNKKNMILITSLKK